MKQHTAGLYGISFGVKLPDTKGKGEEAKANREWIERGSIVHSVKALHPLYLGSMLPGYSENFHHKDEDRIRAWDYHYNGHIIFDRARAIPQYKDEIIIRVIGNSGSEAVKIIKYPPTFLHFKTYDPETGNLTAYRYYDGEKVAAFLKERNAHKNDNWYMSNYRPEGDIYIKWENNDDGTTFAAWDARLTPELLVYSAG
jgi:hypothetical protein